MLTPLRLILPALTIATATVRAAITVPGADGSDGALNITASTEIDLSQAVTGTWDASNTANAGKGIYDPEKWAVVFKYSSVNVAAGATVTFKNHISRAPVVWLVNGNVTIAGTVSLDGQNASSTAISPLLAEPGPGGFRGGSGYFAPSVSYGSGFGPGGAGGARGGSYGSIGGEGPPTYGNPSLVPLIGGSGGGGEGQQQWNGAAGGGAMLLACSGTITCLGQISAKGGREANDSSFWDAGGGSGGGVRIVADSVVGSGDIVAIGGAGWGSGGVGRIRLERVINNNTITVTPDPSVVDLPANATALLWPPSTAPAAKILSIGGVNSPADPKAAFGTVGADVSIPTPTPPPGGGSATPTTPVIVETTNVQAESVVKVRGTPRSNGNYTEVTATLQSTVSTSPLVIRWIANLPVANGYTAVQARIIRP